METLTIKSRRLETSAKRRGFSPHRNPLRFAEVLLSVTKSARTFLPRRWPRQ